MSPGALLQGARIRRIDSPAPELFAFTLASPTYKGVLLVALGREVFGLGLSRERPRGQGASAFTQRLRRQLDGAKLLRVEQRDASTVAFHVTRGDGEKQLVLDFAARPSPNLVVLDAAGESVASLHANAGPAQRSATRTIEWPDSLEALEAAGAALLAASADGSIEAQRAALDRGLAAADKRVARKLASIATDAERAGEAPELRARATLVLANLASIPRGARTAKLTDYTHDPPRELEITLDPALPAREQAEAWFKRARRFERGAEIARERTTQVQAEQQQLRALRDELRVAADSGTLSALVARAKRLNVEPREAAPSDAEKRKAKPPTRLPYREFRGHADRPILVGKGAADNDELTLRHARPHDLWLHARDSAGAHVVVPLDRNESCPPELLIDAALLTAHFSAARDEGPTDISYTPRRHITKPRGAATGSVNVLREKVLHLIPNPTRLAQLLAAELKPR
jgi:predicted ribosome quality control (RQC) complex YloA/Tae2 family protein